MKALGTIGGGRQHTSRLRPEFCCKKRCRGKGTEPCIRTKRLNQWPYGIESSHRRWTRTRRRCVAGTTGVDAALERHRVPTNPASPEEAGVVHAGEAQCPGLRRNAAGTGELDWLKLLWRTSWSNAADTGPHGSDETVRQTLKKTNSSPGESQCWCIPF